MKLTKKRTTGQDWKCSKTCLPTTAGKMKMTNPWSRCELKPLSHVAFFQPRSDGLCWAVVLQLPPAALRIRRRHLCPLAPEVRDTTMYSVEDLLISHGYKLPKSGPPSATPYDKRPADCQRELVDNRAGRGTLNGYEADRGASLSGIYSSRQALVKGYPATDNESGDRNQRRKELGIGILGDAQPLGDSLATDSGWVFFFPLPFFVIPRPSASPFPSHLSWGPLVLHAKRRLHCAGFFLSLSLPPYLLPRAV